MEDPLGNISSIFSANNLKPTRNNLCPFPVHPSYESH